MPCRDDLPSSTFLPPLSAWILNQDRVLTSNPSPTLAATFCVSSATSVDAADSLGALTALPSSPESL